MTWFSEDDLRGQAGDMSFARGAKYLEAVETLDDVAGGVTAVVTGTDRYIVRLRDVDGELVGECTCPHAADGFFCKHCVAVGLLVLEGAADGGAADIRGYVESLERAELIDLLVGHANEDPVLFRKLSLKAGRDDVDVLRRHVEGTLRLRGFVGFQGTLAYVAKVREVLVTAGEVRDGPLLCRIVELVVEALDFVEDSFGTLGDEARSALALYADVCADSPPEPKELAEWLLRLDLDGSGRIEVSIADFTGGLGFEGLAAVRAGVEERWRLDDGEDPTRSRKLQRLREGFAAMRNWSS
ncbi:SWIM zinc finger domain-containing protein [Amycolatopsis sp. lyj-112]|uniref:SWIM zinc finger family protein n=1 Tax=Amycolatopsis sp. lyj-112 TaxID=2789288 RepID=UPI00397A604A